MKEGYEGRKNMKEGIGGRRRKGNGLVPSFIFFRPSRSLLHILLSYPSFIPLLHILLSYPSFIRKWGRGRREGGKGERDERRKGGRKEGEQREKGGRKEEMKEGRKEGS